MSGKGSKVLVDDLMRVYKAGKLEVVALRGVDMEVAEGETVAIMGPSGCGKTTLLNLIGGLDRPTAGRVIVDGITVSDLNDTQLVFYRREKVGFVFQFFNLIPTLTAKENVQFALELAARDGVPSGLDPDSLLERVGLGDRKSHFPSQLSGGEQQRVAVARALAKDPVMILGDEPTGNLDFRTGKLVLKALRDVNREEGKTVIIVTHNSPMAAVADRVLHLRDGAVTQIDVNEHPIDPEDVVW